MDLYAIYSYYAAKKLINAGYKVHHIEKNKKPRFEGMIVFFFENDGNIEKYLK